jgi:hypothetical protein
LALADAIRILTGMATLLTERNYGRNSTTQSDI